MKKRTKAQQIVSALKRGWVSPMTAYVKFGCMSFNQRCNEWKRAGTYAIQSRKNPKNPAVVDFRIT